jgi:HK97 gp10 family phage protein
MAEYSVEIKGLDRFREALSKYPNIAKGYFATAIENAAWRVTRGAKKRSPVDTGRLRASIYPTIADKAAVISPQVEYAIYVHEGTRYQRAQPFLSNALTSEQMNIQGDFEEALEKTLDEIARRS